MKIILYKCIIKLISLIILNDSCFDGILLSRQVSMLLKLLYKRSFIKFNLITCGDISIKICKPIIFVRAITTEYFRTFCDFNDCSTFTNQTIFTTILKTNDEY